MEVSISILTAKYLVKKLFSIILLLTILVNTIWKYINLHKVLLWVTQEMKFNNGKSKYNIIYRYKLINIDEILKGKCVNDSQILFRLIICYLYIYRPGCWECHLNRPGNAKLSGISWNKQVQWEVGLVAHLLREFMLRM